MHRDFINSVRSELQRGGKITARNMPDLIRCLPLLLRGFDLTRCCECNTWMIEQVGYVRNERLICKRCGKKPDASGVYGLASF